jgi:hypothetical protein
MGSADGTVVGVEKVANNGPDDQNWNLVIMGDGFTKDEQGKFKDHVSGFVRHMQGTAPFSENAVWRRVNVHRIDVWSKESGADNPPTCADGSSPIGGAATTAATYFDASFCNYGHRRFLEVNNGLALTTAASKVPNVHNVLVAVNSIEEGGTGGFVGCYSLGSVTFDTALHELGHVAFQLGDEYEYLSSCLNIDKDNEMYTGPEPTQPNITKNGSDRATLKWRHLVGMATDLPTTKHTLCIVCPPQTNPVSASTVGAFVGAGTFHCGLYRPMFNCKMRQVEQPFCPVCKDAIRRKLAVMTPPPSSCPPAFAFAGSSRFRPRAVAPLA